MNLYFAKNEGHTYDRQSLKVSKRFDDVNRRYHIMSIYHFAIKLFFSVIRNKLIILSIISHKIIKTINHINILYGMDMISKSQPFLYFSLSEYCFLI